MSGALLGSYQNGVFVPGIAHQVSDLTEKVTSWDEKIASAITFGKGLGTKAVVYLARTLGAVIALEALRVLSTLFPHISAAASAAGLHK